MDKLTPTPEQEAAIQATVNEPTHAALNASDLGVGKSLMAVESSLRMNAKQTLISAPLHTRYGWQDTYLNQGGTDFRWINNANKSGREALQDFEWGRPGAYFIGRELFRLKDWEGMKPDLYIADESHSFSNKKSRAFKTNMRLKAGYKIAQSATWYGGSWENAWTSARVLWPDRQEPFDIADRSHYRWMERWCKTEYDPFAYNHKRVVGEKNPGEFANALPLYINLRSDQIEPQVIPIYIDLSPRQRKLYDQMEKDALSWLRSNPLVAELPPVKRARLRQITLAECDVDNDDVVHFPDDAHSSTIDALKELLDDLQGEQVLLGTDSALFARLAAKRIPGVFAWTGDAKEDEREVAKARFINGDLRCIIATQAAIGEGTDGLQFASHIIVEASKADWGLLNQQFIGRLNRRGQAKRVLDYQIICRDTLDDEQSNSLLSQELAARQSMLKED